MRTIKFRGKRLDDGEWVYGHYADYIHPDCGIPSPSIIYLLPGCGNMIVAVKPASIGQFTGLHDRNGKEIYEGDIVEYSDHHPTSDGQATLEVGEVKYESGALWLPTCLLCEASSTRLIGNIHDNPKKQKL